jgi:hypothetical protein
MKGIIMKIVNVTTKEQLDVLYDESALTFEGLMADEENLNALYDWLKEHHGIITGTEPTFHIISGKVMNDNYHLTGNNAYKDDLTIVSCTDIADFTVSIFRFELGGRWFDDIVDNNARREDGE